MWRVRGSGLRLGSSPSELSIAGCSAVDAAGGGGLEWVLRDDDGTLQWDCDCGDCRGSAGGAVWADVYLAGNGEVYVRHGCLHAAAYRDAADGLEEPAADDDCVAGRRY